MPSINFIYFGVQVLVESNKSSLVKTLAMSARLLGAFGIGHRTRHCSIDPCKERKEQDKEHS